jgi:hypothetical protein
MSSRFMIAPFLLPRRAPERLFCTDVEAPGNTRAASSRERSPPSITSTLDPVRRVETRT